MSLPCGVCRKLVAKDQIKCKVCLVTVAHPSCASRDTKTPSDGLSQQPPSWTCRDCRVEVGSSGSTKDYVEGPLGEQFAALEANLIKQMNTNRDDLRKKLSDVENSLDFLSKKYDDLLEGPHRRTEKWT
jgi:hypothetical protein